ncbi:MAG: ABC transporter substrate-binding protein [Nitrospirae bacterium]|nr:ABC transporter substrate-binding protein [Nitrospirota bacterium]
MLSASCSNPKAPSGGPAGGQSAGGSQSAADRQPAADRQSAGGPLTVKVGIIAALSGPAASYGISINNGFKLAAEEINFGADVKLTVLVEDSAGSQEQALSAVKKLINSDSVSALLGPTLSTEMRVVGPEANSNGVPILATSNTAEGITGIGKYVLRDSMPETIAIPAAIGQAVKRYGIKSVAILYGDDDVFTKSGFDTMKRTAESTGLKITDVEKFQKGQADYNAQLTKIKSTNPDCVLCSALYNEGAVIIGQARKMGLTVPFIGGNGFNSPRVVEIAGGAANGLIVATPWFPLRQDRKVKDFITNYEKRFGQKPDQFSAQAYDGMYMLAEAIKKAGSADRDKIRDSLAGIKNFDGVLGTFSFDENRDVSMAPYVLIVENGQFRLFQ